MSPEPNWTVEEFLEGAVSGVAVLHTMEEALGRSVRTALIHLVNIKTSLLELHQKKWNSLLHQQLCRPLMKTLSCQEAEVYHQYQNH